MDISYRKSIFKEIGTNCHFSSEHDFIEVTEWSNGEGYDVDISRKTEHERFSITIGEFYLLRKLMDQINHECKEDEEDEQNN